MLQAGRNGDAESARLRCRERVGRPNVTHKGRRARGLLPPAVLKTADQASGVVRRRSPAIQNAHQSSIDVRQEASLFASLAVMLAVRFGPAADSKVQPLPKTGGQPMPNGVAMARSLRDREARGQISGPRSYGLADAQRFVGWKQFVPAGLDVA